MSFVVLPSFEVPQDNLEAFLAAARDDAESSLASEPGCQQFDVCVDRSASPVRVTFYEVYRDRAAFERHMQTAHLDTLRGKLHLCGEGPVQFFNRVVP